MKAFPPSTARQAGAPSLQPRRFGAVNWIGLGALIGRQIRGGLADYHYQVLGPVVSCLLDLTIFQLAISTMRGDAGGGLLAFIAPGLIIYAACEKAYEASAATLILDKHERVIFDQLMAPVTAFERSLAYCIGPAVCGLAVGVAVAVMSLIFAPLRLHDPLALVFFALAGTVMHGLIGTLVGVWAQKWDQYAAILTFMLLPLSFLSGVFYRIADLPELAQDVIRFNPIFYVIDGFRHAFTGEGTDIGLAVLVVAAVDLVLFLWVYLWFRTGYRLKP
ncbi:MAG: multidrug ABC transporter permease [Rhodospirillaceae bacterium]|nr:MAG: multidrug ABC transporter permease [Rhodospirillaceae bacterium]